jgi:ATP-dependent exoDNAse (exonuclease V) alpha subunit
VRLCDGTTAGVGDVVVTRLNQRALTTTGNGWVKNGDDWTIRAVRDDGSLHVSRPGGATAVLPAGYVAEHVELGYAATAHRAQGRTVDTAHAYLSAGTTREPLYVMATRGRQANQLYVDTATEPEQATAHGPGERLEAIDILQHAIAFSAAELSAIETRRREQHRQHARNLMRRASWPEPGRPGPSRDLL